MKQFFHRLILLVSVVMLFTACREEIDESPSSHTLLIYMVGDNDLSSYCKYNTNDCIEGLLASNNPLNLIIYEDSKVSGNHGTPVLFRLKRNAVDKQKVDTIMIKEYSYDQDSASPNILKKVIDDAFFTCPSDIKGLEIWSHGLGWAPGDNYRVTRSADATRAQQYIGIDGTNYLEIWDLRQALANCPHLDYIIFDACNMAQAEVAYELREAADFMVACPTEIMAAGLPYSKMIKSLSTCQNRDWVPEALKSVIDDFASYYPGDIADSRRFVENGGTVSLIDLREIAGVHTAYKKLLAECADRVQFIDDNPASAVADLQRFGRFSFYYHFFDLLSVADFYDNKQNHSSYVELKKALERTVVKEYHSQYVLDFYQEMQSCGLGVAVPEFFKQTYIKDILQSGYNELQWSKDQ